VLAGGLLSAMPPLLGCNERGRELLGQSIRELESHPELLADEMPGLRDRVRIHAAFLLLQCLTRAEPEAADERARAAAPTDEPTLGELRQIICCLDPGSSFAQAAFLAGREGPPTQKEMP